ncbi:MAG TPA: penicillin-binding protein [Cellulomonas sp.]
MPSSPPRRGRQVTVGQTVALLMAFVLTAGVGGLLTAGLVLPVVAAASTATDLSVQAFDDLPSELEPTTLSEKSTLLASDGTVLAEFYSENRVVVSIDAVSSIMQSAVIATEDKRFYQHGGIDPSGMVRAAVQTLLGNTQGASTLTQQYVKNVLIETAVQDGDLAAAEAAKETEGAEGYARKLREAKLAISVEKTMTKDQILEAYLNIAQFGVATYGVESAAERYFSISAADLNYLQAATIAGITKSPTAYDPVKNPEASEGRRNTVLKLMLEQDYITQEEYDTGIATPIADTLNVSESNSGCMAAGDVVAGSGYFCDYVTQVIRNDSAFGETADEREELLYRGGLTITTTLDPTQQTIADTEVKAGVPVDDSSGVASAISVVEPGTGEIKAMAQNRIYNNTSEAGDRETSVNYNVSYDYGGSTGFAPGSLFKPFTLLEWLRQGHSLTEKVNGSVRTLNLNQFTSCGTTYANQSWSPGNSEGGSGTMTVLDATKNSVNLAYLSMAMELDLCNIMDGAADLGVVKAGGSSGTGAFQASPANVLGSDSTTPLALAGAYAAFASGGTYCEPIAITSVQDSDGNELAVPSANCTQVIDSDTAAAINYALSNVWTGTGKSIGTPTYTASGKTGTTSENEYTWFAGYTPRLAAVVWVGYSDSMTPVQKMTINGTYYKAVYGSSIAGPTWKRFMDQALADGQENPDFTSPTSEDVYGAEVSIPSVVGLDQATATSTLESAGFVVAIGTPVDSDLSAGAVVSQDLTGTAVAGTTVTLVTSTGVSESSGATDDSTSTTTGAGTGTDTGSGSIGGSP